MADRKNRVIRLDGRIAKARPGAREDMSGKKQPSEVIAGHPVVEAAAQLMDDVLHGDVVGVSIITYASDWSFKVSNAGSVLRTPGAGIVAAHVLASDMESRLKGR